MSFSDLGLSSPLLKALELAEYTTATPIQVKAIPPILAGRDVLGSAQTGTGKTGAFALPTLDRVTAMKEAAGGATAIRCLVLTPTRELALQVSTSFNKYGRGTGLRYAVVFGGVSQHGQVQSLRSGVDVLIATPGRLEDLHQQRHIDLSQVELLILDEADQMLDMGFVVPIRRIAKHLKAPRQTLMFSATMPREIKQLAAEMLKNYVEVSVVPAGTATELVEQKAYLIDTRSKGFLLRHVLKQPEVVRSLVFSRTKHGADRIARGLVKSGISAAPIHGNRSQSQRNRALDDFKKGKLAVLVATDVAARGLHIPEVSHVINFDLPEVSETYVHRIGRTGRAGASGIALSFVDGEDRYHMRNIEKLIKKQVEILPTPEFDTTEPPEPKSHASKAPHRAPNPAYAKPHGQHRNDPSRAGHRDQPRDSFRGATRDPEHAPQHEDHRPEAHRPSPNAHRPYAASAQAPNAHASATYRPPAAKSHAPKPRHEAPPVEKVHVERAQVEKPHVGKSHAETPHVGKSHAGTPNAGKPHVGNPHAEKPHHAKAPHLKPHADGAAEPTIHRLPTPPAKRPHSHAPRPHASKPHAHAPKPHHAHPAPRPLRPKGPSNAKPSTHFGKSGQRKAFHRAAAAAK